jgi:Holliday junction resolvase RusA-like endonuclease
VKLELNLPFPISANRLWRSNRNRVHISPEYHKWKIAADGLFYLYLSGKTRPQMIGKFTVSIILGDHERRRGDGDNRIKCVLDWLQSRSLIRNDSMCDGGAWSWGEAPEGCRVIIDGEPCTAGESKNPSRRGRLTGRVGLG